MRPFRTILFAADFSVISQAAFRVACSLAVESQARLVVLHVAELPLTFEEPVSLRQPDMRSFDAARDEVRQQYLRREMREAYAPDRAIDVDYRLREGDASEEIIRTAEDIEADLIVIGTHGRTGLRRLLAGSVATTVLRRTRCPVLALSSHNRPHRAKEIRVILHPTDFSESSEAALRVARSLARDHGARLILLHVAPVQVVMEGAVTAELDLGCDRDALEAAREIIDGPDLKYPVEARSSRGLASGEIVRLAADLECDLIVMGSHGRSGLARLLMGSVAELVLAEADCPVLVVKSIRREGDATPRRAAAEAATVR
jgi:nucleotide-binding universal stress UspA family protein